MTKNTGDILMQGELIKMGTPDSEHFQSLIYFKPLPKSNIFSLGVILQFILKYVFYNSERHNSQ